MDNETRTITLTHTDALALLWHWHIEEGLESDVPLDNRHDDDRADGKSPAVLAVEAALQKIADAFGVDVPG